MCVSSTHYCVRVSRLPSRRRREFPYLYVREMGSTTTFVQFKCTRSQLR